MTKITKELKEAWKKANDGVCIVVDEDQACFVFRMKTAGKDGYEDTSTEARFNGFHGSLPSGFKRAHFSFLWYYKKEGNINALKQLTRVGDEVRFRVSDNRNGYLKEARVDASNMENPHYHSNYEGLHNDTLWVDVLRDGKPVIVHFELAHSIGPSNSARALQ